MDEINFQAFLRPVFILHFLANIVTLAGVVSQRLPLPGKNTTEVQDYINEVKCNAGWVEPATFSQIPHTRKINLVFNGSYMY